THDYLVAPPAAFPGIADAALLLEGIALMWVTDRQARDHAARPLYLLAAIAAAGGAAALLTVLAAVRSAFAGDSAVEAVRLLLNSRASVHVADLNAAGSSFAMAVCLAAALAMNTRWTRP